MATYYNIYGLNPFSIGIWSVTVENGTPVEYEVSLNPCSIGIWSVTETIQWLIDNKWRSLNPCSIGIWSVTRREMSN